MTQLNGYDPNDLSPMPYKRRLRPISSQLGARVNAPGAIGKPIPGALDTHLSNINAAYSTAEGDAPFSDSEGAQRPNIRQASILAQQNMPALSGRQPAYLPQVGEQGQELFDTQGTQEKIGGFNSNALAMAPRPSNDLPGDAPRRPLSLMGISGASPRMFAGGSPSSVSPQTQATVDEFSRNLAGDQQAIDSRVAADQQAGIWKREKAMSAGRMNAGDPNAGAMVRSDQVGQTNGLYRDNGSGGVERWGIPDGYQRPNTTPLANGGAFNQTNNVPSGSQARQMDPAQLQATMSADRGLTGDKLMTDLRRRAIQGAMVPGASLDGLSDEDKQVATQNQQRAAGIGNQRQAISLANMSPQYRQSMQSLVGMQRAAQQFQTQQRQANAEAAIAENTNPNEIAKSQAQAGMNRVAVPAAIRAGAMQYGADQRLQGVEDTNQQRRDTAGMPARAPSKTQYVAGQMKAEMAAGGPMTPDEYAARYSYHSGNYDKTQGGAAAPTPVPAPTASAKTAMGPNGEKLILSNGQWVPAK